MSIINNFYRNENCVRNKRERVEVERDKYVTFDIDSNILKKQIIFNCYFNATQILGFRKDR